MANWTQDEINDVYAQLKDKSAKDAGFRKELLADPNKAIAKMSGKDVPSSLKIKVLEADPAYNATFILPDLIADEFTDEDLEKVAGGSGSICAAEGCGAEACAANAQINK